MLGIEICVDVPDLARGIRFPRRRVRVLHSLRTLSRLRRLSGQRSKNQLLEKHARTKASPNAEDVRRY